VWIQTLELANCLPYEHALIDFNGLHDVAIVGENGSG